MTNPKPATQIAESVLDCYPDIKRGAKRIRARDAAVRADAVGECIAAVGSLGSYPNKAYVLLVLKILSTPPEAP